jgi:hypothetical protein
MITLLMEGGCVFGTIDINGSGESRGMIAVIKGKSYTFGLNVDFDGLSLLFRSARSLARMWMYSTGSNLIITYNR